MKPLCIYHGGCDDGFAAAWVVRKALGADNVDFYPGVHQQAPPDVTGRDVIMVDFSYKRPVIEAMGKSAKSILILDHHKTAQEDLRGLIDPPNARSFQSNWGAWQYAVASIEAPRVAALFDMTRSGATLAWDYFLNILPRPKFINYIEDRDLWRKVMKDGDEFTIALRSYPQEFAVWDELFGRENVRSDYMASDYMVHELIKAGEDIQRYYRRRVEEMKASAYKAVLAGHPIWISNAPYFAASEVAGELAEQGLDFGACYFESKGGVWQYSLRSRGDFDVSKVATIYGGGGHRAAAGFSTSFVAHLRIEE